MIQTSRKVLSPLCTNRLGSGLGNFGTPKTLEENIFESVLRYPDSKTKPKKSKRKAVMKTVVVTDLIKILETQEYEKKKKEEEAQQKKSQKEKLAQVKEKQSSIKKQYQEKKKLVASNKKETSVKMKELKKKLKSSECSAEEKSRYTFQLQELANQLRDSFKQ